MIDEDSLKTYFRNRFAALRLEIRKIGSGVQGSGFLVDMDTPEGPKSCIIKDLNPEGLGHDYPSDRAAVFLLDLDEYKNLPNHVRALDVLAEREDGSIFSIGGGKEYYLLMEQGKGKDYFNDLRELAGKDRLDVAGVRKIESMAAYLAGIHRLKNDSRILYWRKIRDTIGHGECLMGVLDTYPDGILSYEEMAEIEKKTVQWRARLKPKYRRLCRVHGDFHPGNIWFREAGDQKSEISGADGNRATENAELRAVDFILLDRSRGPWGEPADDVTALTINYIFFSMKHHGIVKGAYLEGLRLFYDAYMTRSGDDEMYYVVQPFYAFRGAVVANPVFYPELTPEQRRKIFRFINKVLDSEKFEPERVNEYFK